MCGRAYDGRMLYSWPNSQIGIMGGEQAAKTLAEVKLRQLERRGETADQSVLDQVYNETLEAYQHQMSPYFATSELWDDGLIDPVDTRNALGISISASLNAPLADQGYGIFRL